MLDILAPSNLSLVTSRSPAVANMNKDTLSNSLKESSSTANPTLVNDNTKADALQSTSNIILQPNQSDILFGRGRPYQGHFGNRKLREIVDHFRKEYAAARRYDKLAIAEEIVKGLQGGRWGDPSRFLRRAEDGEDCWIEVSDVVAREKVSHTLRGKQRESTKLSSFVEDSMPSKSPAASAQTPSTPNVPGTGTVENIDSLRLQATMQESMLAQVRQSILLQQQQEASLLAGLPFSLASGLLDRRQILPQAHEIPQAYPLFQDMTLSQHLAALQSHPRHTDLSSLPQNPSTSLFAAAMNAQPHNLSQLLQLGATPRIETDPSEEKKKK
eukprot:Nitzschia sp. Nitz4//scaffold306_size21755//13825//14808//NITZ4_008591-RA/size21755-processed-gene-0.9-mRNA-1//-1//CDS//3329547117//439//frame0